MEYKVKDYVLSQLTLSNPVTIKVRTTKDKIRLHVDKREYVWNEETGEVEYQGYQTKKSNSEEVNEGRYGAVYPGTDAPVGILGAIAKEIDLLKEQSDRILQRYLLPVSVLRSNAAAAMPRSRGILLQTITSGELDTIKNQVKFSTDQLKRVRFADEVKEDEDDPRYVV